MDAYTGVKVAWVCSPLTHGRFRAFVVLKGAGFAPGTPSAKRSVGITAVSVAATTGAMIDGVWLRQALTPLTAPDRAAAVRMIERVIDAEIAP